MSRRFSASRVRLAARDQWPVVLPPMSIRLRLTLLYTSVLAASILVFGLALYALLTRALDSEVDQETTSRAHEIAVGIQVRGDPPADQLAVTLPPTTSMAPDTFVQVTDARTGQVVARSSNLDDRQLPLQPETLSLARQGQSSFETLRMDGQRLRIYNLPLLAKGRVVGVVQVSRSRATDDLLLRRLRLLLPTLAALALPVAAGLGWILSGRVLTPIEEIADSAAAIGRARAFALRVVHRGPLDELGRLAATINTMLAELEAAHRDLAVAKTDLEHTVAGQRRFLADASHELRTPLTTIRMNAELLRESESTDVSADHAKALADITDEAERMSRLVNDLLILARADAGQRLTLRPTPLRPLVEVAYRQAQLLAVGQEVELGTIEEAMVLGDADTLRQLLLILLDNALKYTPDGGRVIIVLCSVTGHAHLTVTDTGMGIVPADLPQIFERFYRADAARETSGSGLGLAIARWIAEQHAGRIEVTSTLGVGSTFSVVLPACLTNSASLPEPLTFR
ncbi:MAG: sensor histidine kinase [Thermomicrobiales bacterium]